LFFILSKIVFFLIQPLLIGIIFLSVGWFILCRGNKSGRYLVRLGFFVLVFFSWSVVPEILFKPLESYFPDQSITNSFDVIVVLGGGFKILKSGNVKFGALNRIVQGIALTKQYPDSKLVLSGGTASIINPNPREADYMKELALQLGVPDENIIVERNSRNTYEQAVEISKLIDDSIHNNTYGKLILITSAFHMPRAVGCFKKAELKLIPYSVDYIHNGLGLFDLFTFSSENLMLSRTAIKEWLGLLVYRLLDYTDKILPSFKKLER